MNRQVWNTSLEMLASLNRHELDAAGSNFRWEWFRRRPFRYFIKADDFQRKAIWEAIQRRLPRAVRC